MKQTFEEFLKDRHAESYHGLDDDMPDSYDNWELDGEEYMEYAQIWGDIQYQEGRISATKDAIDIITK